MPQAIERSVATPTMKARLPEDELAKQLIGWKVAEVHRLVVPGLDEERHVVELCRSHDKTD